MLRKSADGAVSCAEVDLAIADDHFWRGGEVVSDACDDGGLTFFDCLYVFCLAGDIGAGIEEVDVIIPVESFGF